MMLTFKKNFRLLPVKFIFVFFLVIFNNNFNAQVTIFSENMGTSGAGGNPVITSFSSFQNSNCSYTYAGTGDVRNNTTSSGYTGASGSNNAFLDNGLSKTLIISGINTLGYTGLSLSYGVYCSGFFTVGGGLTVETSTNGITYTALTRPGNFWFFPGWSSETCTGTIPNTSNLFIRFTNATGGSDFRIDDIILSGTIVAPTNPTPYNSWPTAFTFNNWAATNTAGTYPSNMIFHYGAINNIHPSLAQITASQNYALAYNLASSCDSKITGQGVNGVSFVNGNPGNSGVGSGNLGETILALNTLCRNNINVSWRAGTITNNGNAYKLRAQYRVGTTGAYTDLPNSALTQIEYTSNSGTINFGPIALPAACNNQPVVHIRWAFYRSGAGTGIGDEIFLTNVNVTSNHPVTIFSVTGGGSYCSGGSGVAIGLSGSQVGVNYQLKNGATNIGSPVAGTGSAISFGTQTASATYTVLATDVSTSCTNSMTGTAVITINALPSINLVSNQSVCGGKAVAAINFSSPSPGATFTWTNSNTSIGLAASGTGNIGGYTSPNVPLPPNVVGTISVAAVLSGCTGTATTFSITIKGPQPASVWNGTVSNDWFDSNNWSNCVCGSITSATIPSITGPNFNPVIAGSIAANVNGITLNSGANLSFQTTQTLNVYGNWINNGTFNAQQGKVVLSGNTAQTLSGNTTTFYDLTLNNSAGAVNSSTQQIQGSLQLNAGTFNTNNNLTLVSNATGTGKIGPINPAADIINQVTIQQYAPGGSTGWALLGAPLSSPITMASWNDNFAITCLSCPDGSVVSSVPFTSIYSYDETIAGTYSSTAKYIPITTISAGITNGKGYWTYLGNGFPNTTAITFDVKGTVAKSSCLSCSGAVTIPVSRTINNGLLDDGWNLISNPLPSPISWAALRNGNSNVDNAVYAFNADLNGGLGDHTTYVNGISSHITGGITDVIPMCQGFYIHATASTVLTANENIKVNANPTFLKSNTISTIKPIARLVMDNSTNSKDMATFYFEQGGTPHFQADYDAYKMIFDASLPYICSMSDTINTCINGLPQLNTNLFVPVKAITPTTSSYTFSLLKTDFPNDVCVTLFDAFTGITTNILTSDYSCTLYDTTSIARFTINFFSTPLAGTTNVLQATCTQTQGLITAIGNNAGPWNYEWKQGNTIVKTSSNKATADSLISFNGGNYTVKINTVGQCDNFNQSFNLTTIQLPTAAFSIPTNTVSIGAQINFTDLSVNSQNSIWDFGDGFGTSNFSNPVYSYSLAGNYTVILIAQSADMCTDTASMLLTVINDINGISAFSKENNVLLLYDNVNAAYLVACNFSSAKNITLTLISTNGKIMRLENYNSVLSDKLNINMAELAKGAYILNVSSNNKTLNTFKLIK